jgi:hypothetical protein
MVRRAGRRVTSLKGDILRKVLAQKDLRPYAAAGRTLNILYPGLPADLRAGRKEQR